MSSKRYEFLEHTADLRFRAYGKTLGECFANAARAMFFYIVDPSTLRRGVMKTVQVKADTLEMLLHDWLSESLLLFEMEGMLFADFSADVSGDVRSGFVLNGTLKGEKLNKRFHKVLADIKAVTYHEISVKKENGRWTCEVLCDV